MPATVLAAMMLTEGMIQQMTLVEGMTQPAAWPVGTAGAWKAPVKDTAGSVACPVMEQTVSRLLQLASLAVSLPLDRQFPAAGNNLAASRLMVHRAEEGHC